MNCDPIREMLEQSKSKSRRLDAVIRRETQKYINRREAVYMVTYITFLVMLLMVSAGWVSSQLLDYVNLTTSVNPYLKFYTS